jgi:hypothetical protein
MIHSVDSQGRDYHGLIGSDAVLPIEQHRDGALEEPITNRANEIVTKQRLPMVPVWGRGKAHWQSEDIYMAATAVGRPSIDRRAVGFPMSLAHGGNHDREREKTLAPP